MRASLGLARAPLDRVELRCKGINPNGGGARNLTALGVIGPKFRGTLLDQDGELRENIPDSVRCRLRPDLMPR